MKNLIIVRHGSYLGAPHLSDTALSDEGQTQMIQLRDQLQLHYLPPTKVVSSSFKRCQQSAEILAEGTGLLPFLTGAFVSGGNSRVNLPTALKVIQQQGEGANTVVVVTHYEYALVLPSYFGEKALGIDTFPIQELPKGRAWVIDCEAKTCVMV